MVIVSLLIQIVANLLLLFMIRYLGSTCKIPLTIHNLPIVIFWSIGLSFVMWLSVTHFTVYLMGAFWISLLLWISRSGEARGYLSRIGICVLGFVFWAQLLTVMIFYATHREQIDNENPELR